MPMTARQLVNKTPKSRRWAAQYAKIKAVRHGKQENGNIVFKAKILTTNNPDGTKKPEPPVYIHITTAEFMPRGACIVSCTCEDFCFTWEYTLNKHGAARIEYSNGESSKDRNPKQIPGTCKHIYAFLTRLIDKGKV
jgi:hypothetical protein